MLGRIIRWLEGQGSSEPNRLDLGTLADMRARGCPVRPDTSMTQEEIDAQMVPEKIIPGPVELLGIEFEGFHTWVPAHPNSWPSTIPGAEAGGVRYRCDTCDRVVASYDFGGFAQNCVIDNPRFALALYRHQVTCHGREKDDTLELEIRRQVKTPKEKLVRRDALYSSMATTHSSWDQEDGAMVNDFGEKIERGDT